MLRILIFILCLTITTPAYADKTTIDEKGNKVTQYDNGAMFVEKPNGTEITIDPDGSRLIEREDGSIEQWTTLDEGWERIINHPDGTRTVEERPMGWREGLPYDYEGPEYEIESWRGESYPIYLGLNMEMNKQKEWDSDPDENHIDPLNPGAKEEHDAEKEAKKKQKEKDAAFELFIDHKFLEAEQKGLISFGGNVNDSDEAENDKINKLYVDFTNEWYEIHGYETEQDYLNHQLILYDSEHGLGLTTAEQDAKDEAARNKFIEETKTQWAISQNIRNYDGTFTLNFDDERTAGRNTAGQNRDETHAQPPNSVPVISGQDDLIAGVAGEQVKESSAIAPVNPKDSGLNYLPAVPEGKDPTYIVDGNVIVGAGGSNQPDKNKSESDPIKPTFITEGNQLMNDDGHHRDRQNKKEASSGQIDWGNGFSTVFTPGGHVTESESGEKSETKNGKTQCQDSKGNVTYSQDFRSYNQPLVQIASLDLTGPIILNQINPAVGGGIFNDGAPTVDILVNDRISQVIDGVAPFFFDISEFLGVYNITNKTGFLNQPGFTTITITVANPATGEVQFTPNDPVVPSVIGGVNLEQGVFGARVPTPPPNVEIRNGSFTKLPNGNLQIDGLYDDQDIVMQGNVSAQR